MADTLMQVITPYLTLALGGVLIPAAGYLVKTAFTVKTRFDIHEERDRLMFEGVMERLEDLKTDSNAQNGKLDDIRDRLPRRRD